MNKLEVFEPAMCCPTGVCGVNVDPMLVQFNADLQALTQSGIEVVRHRATTPQHLRAMPTWSRSWRPAWIACPS